MDRTMTMRLSLRSFEPRERQGGGCHEAHPRHLAHWPPPADVTVDAVSDLAARIVMSGVDLTERQVELVHCSVRSAVENGLAQWESFARPVRALDRLDAHSLSAGSNLPGWHLASLSKRGMPQYRRKNKL